VPQDFNFLPGSLEAAKQELAFLATPGTSWPIEAAPLEAAEKSMGGKFLLVSCGEYGEDHPLVGDPAYALFQVVFCSCQAAQGFSPYTLKIGKAVSFTLSKDRPQDLLYPLGYIIAYEVDGEGWPTGACVT
jgi:hypothetical protein